MTIATGLELIGTDELSAALEDHLAPQLTVLLGRRLPGHCMRCDDLEAHLATGLARRLRSSTRAEVHVLGGTPEVPEDVASSTRIVELRNPEAGGQLRPPLLVFVPPGTRASAEDSFGVATFEQIDLGSVYQALADTLTATLPEGLAGGVRELFAVLRDESWPWADDRARCRFLLTVLQNDADRAASGAAVCELGMIPDPDLFDSAITARAARNVRIVAQLRESLRPDRHRVLSLGLTDASFRRALAGFAAQVGLADPLAWTRAIVAERENWQFFFGRWSLADDTSYDEIGIEVGALTLPAAGDNEQDVTHPVLRGITGQRFLAVGSGGHRELAIEFHLDRDPRQVAGLARFRVQLMAEHGDGESTTGAATEVATTVKVSTTPRLGYKAKLRKLVNSGLEEGWHYVRVTAVDGEGLPITVRQHDLGGRMAHESERFYVLPDGDLEEPPPNTRPRRASGVTQAIRDLEFDDVTAGRPLDVTLRAVTWQDPPRGSASSGPRALVADFGPDGLAEIAVSARLSDIQQRILNDPDFAGHWHLSVAVLDPASAFDAATAEASRWADHCDPDRLMAFLAARAELFGAIAGIDSGRPGHRMPVEACDLAAVADLVVRYVEAYLVLMDDLHATVESAERNGALGALSDLARIDTVTVSLTDHRGDIHEAVLVGPTHPQRLLWLTAWSLVGRSWAAAASGRAGAQAARHALFGLRPLGHPFAVPRGDRRLALAAFDLTPFWGVCLPDATPDPHGLMALLQSALSVPGRASLTDVWSGAELADRLELYLRQHPYVRTLLVNAVNVGRGDEIANAVEQLLARTGCAEVGVELRLFVADPEAPGSAEALLELLDGPDPVGALDVFVRDRADFLQPDGEVTAHVTVLFDALSAERVGTTASAQTGVPLPIYGLVQDMVVHYHDDPDVATVWRKYPLLGTAAPLAEREEITDLLSALPATMASVAATLSTGEYTPGRVPEVSLTLSADDSTLLDLAHRRSDWVITVDRTLGVEFFDGPTSEQRPDHVIDYAPERGTALGHQMVVSSRSLDELRALLAPILAESGLALAQHHIRTFFDQLRLLSGRLAFKIASVASSQRIEVLGLALARLYLEREGHLRNQIVVPLDAHLDLYELQRDAAEPDLRRTDLALLHLDAEQRVINCQLVEVKCYSAGGISAYHGLQERIRGQLDQSKAVLASHFDPAGAARPDRPVQNYEFANLLRSYLDRACRHSIMDPTAADAATSLLDTLDRGYRLEFTRSALIFDLAGRGLDTDIEAGIRFVRVGRDIIQEMLDGVPTGPLPLAPLPQLEPGQYSSTGAQRGPAAEPQPGAEPEKNPEVEPPARPEPDSEHEQEPDAEASAVLEADPQPEPEHARPPKNAAPTPGLRPDILVGASRPSPQFGIIGETSPDKLIAVDLDETHTVSLFGVQGGGKSYTLGSIIEAATLPAPPLNQLANPLATIVFHYSATQDYAPEFTSMVYANDDASAVARLRERFGVTPAALADVVLLVPRDQLSKRRMEYPGIDVRALAFGSAELQATHWRFLMGAVGNQATYIRQLNRIMRTHRDDLRLDVLRTAVEQSSLPDHIRTLAYHRLELAGDYIDDSVRLGDVVVPGRLVIVDLRDELIEKDEALGLFVVLMQLFADAGASERFNKLVVFDEAHKYIDSPELVKGLVESVREMRHKGMSVLVASQDPPSVPVSLIELSDHIIVHKVTSPGWLKHLQKANAALATVTSERLAELRPGEAYLWASKSTDPTFTERMVRIRTRPRLTRHGGATRTATRR